jgi:zinc protease
MLAWLKNMSNEPTVIFNDTLQYTAANYHFRSRPLSVKLLDEIDLNKSINIFKDRFADASDFTFVFVGNIDLNTFKPFVETYLGGLPSINRGEKIRDLKYVNVKGERKKEVHKGIEQKSSVGYAYVGDMIWNRKNEHILESLINVLDIKLREAIREEKGGTYGISIWKEIYMLPNPHYTIRITFGCAPDRVQELISSVSQVIDSIKMFGPDAIVLNKVKEIQRKQRELHLKENSFWKGILSNYLQYNDNPVELLDYYKWVDALTADDIKKAINFYINKDVVEVVLYPETIQ